MEKRGKLVGKAEDRRWGRRTPKIRRGGRETSPERRKNRFLRVIAEYTLKEKD